ncbi:MULTISPECIES: ClpXP protease specificity-enhancing factor [Alteromonadaceae]|uniref:ClpXP protease specificity-enhancing factor n=1 Tax=Alteromonadaceae TaxID=72275 RepID=UPI001C0A172F|nr:MULTISPECIES: ClpXP protease specificity-enhancing factor [Aliiglaciecola]MBU2876623.1 ClpXP protease specificity-enhancing factor [Aliiglaciecola lipolytica]MDO6711442.1 ClpXP protease specificity-enhancing factor [Aliiglaciecola sp. 2_MG-2023]MDO6752581.1 ClpXP protease specificity-enhancing factor [Aliiglaciecola sp. 1_MG-2023]
MTSNQPYLLRAFYEWIVDNDLTPYLVVDATVPGTNVPQEHVHDGQIVLNVSPGACVKLNLGDADVSFEARFGGVARQLVVPTHAVLAIYAKENGAGTVFTPEENLTDGDKGGVASKPKATPKPERKGPPNLTVVK